MKEETKKSIIHYANMLKKRHNTNDPIAIARAFNYIVWFPSDISTDFLKATTRKKRDGSRLITINSSYDELSRKVLCAHELGHIILGHKLKLEYGDKNISYEYGANLFAVALLFDTDDFNIPITQMSNYILKTILDKNVKDPTNR